jgi:hypothetical protein
MELDLSELRERERERECVCVCVCVPETDTVTETVTEEDSAYLIHHWLGITIRQKICQMVRCVIRHSSQ